MRILGFLILVAGIAAAFGQTYIDLGLPQDEIQPIGFTLIVVGGVMFLLGGRRRRRSRGQESGGRASKTSSIGYRPPEPESEPEKRKPDITWGREGDPD